MPGIMKKKTPEELARILEYTLTEFQKDLNDNKTDTEKKQAEFINELKRIYGQKIQVDSKEFRELINDFKIYARNQNQNQEEHFNLFVKRFESLMHEHYKVIDGKFNDLKKFKKQINFIYFNYGFFILSLIVLYVAIQLGYKNKFDIQNDYRIELMEKGRYRTDQELILKNRFYHWIDKNPKDSKVFIDKMNRQWEKDKM